MYTSVLYVVARRPFYCAPSLTAEPAMSMLIFILRHNVRLFAGVVSRGLCPCQQALVKYFTDVICSHAGHSRQFDTKSLLVDR
jgi:hypothetical protein